MNRNRHAKRRGSLYTSDVSPPRVLIDLERLRQPYSGLGQVAWNLGRELLAEQDFDWQPVFLLPRNRQGMFGETVEYEVPSWRRRLVPRLAPRYSLWHFLHQDASYFPAPGTPAVLTIHDLNFLDEKSPQKAARRLARVQSLVDRSQAITVISEFTRKRIEEHLDLGQRPVHVIHNGPCTDPDGEARKPVSAPDRPFLFSIGVVRPKKNFHVLVDMLPNLPDFALVVAGNTKGGYADRIRARAAELSVDSRVHVIGEISEAEKIWLFRHCKAFVFPSLYEGFGLPLLEAMCFGKACVSSALTSLPEVGGETVHYWDNFDPDHMAEVVRVAIAGAEKPDLIDALQKRAGRFSWRRAAARYVAVYRDVLSAA